MIAYLCDAAYILLLLAVYTGAVMGAVAIIGATVAILLTLLTK